MKPLNGRSYVPVLKWRQGEYQALLRLTDEVKASVTPLIEICPVEWDFELKREAKTLDEHLEPFGSRVYAKWGGRHAFLDVHLLDPSLRTGGGLHPLTFLGNSGYTHGARLVPVVGFDSSDAHLEAARGLSVSYHSGACLRMDLDDLMEFDLDGSIDEVLSALGIDLDELDIVVDMGAPNFEPLDEFAQLVSGLLGASPLLEQARSLVLAGTSFPDSLAAFDKALHVVPRREWQLYKKVLELKPSNRRIPTFGDYAIAHPVLVAGDMRLLKPSANVRYTTRNAWALVKGRNVRDHGFAQYRDQCKKLIDSGHFAGAGYSAGDRYIEDCAKHGGSTGNMSTWRWVGTNHHLTRVVRDLSSLHGS
jgi:hypothetical protein